MTIRSFKNSNPGKYISVTFEIFKAVKPIYDRQEEGCKGYIAAVFDDFLFLGTSIKLFWSGRQSKKSIQTGDKTSQHCYPRKLSTARLFENLPDTLDEFQKMFIEALKFDYTTSAENHALKPFQKAETFISPEDAYAKAGIEF